MTKDQVESNYPSDGQTDARTETTSVDLAPAENQVESPPNEPKSREDLEPTKTTAKPVLDIGDEEEEFDEGDSDLLNAPKPPKDVPRGKVTPSVGGAQPQGGPKQGGGGR